MSQTGRPSKAKRNPNELSFDKAFEALLGREADPQLVWNVAADEIRSGLQSVGGIALLADVSRKTVYRRGIAPGSMAAILFVRDRRIRKGKPLVVSRGVSVNHRNASGKFIYVLNTIHDWQKQMAPDGNTSVQEVVDYQLKSRPRKSGYGKNVRASPSIREITDKERQLFTKARLFHYEPSGRVTVTQLCSVIEKMSRQAFYKWRKKLPKEMRRRLKDALAGGGQSHNEPDAGEPIEDQVLELKTLIQAYRDSGERQRADDLEEILERYERDRTRQA